MSVSPESAPDLLALLDWRCRIADLYAGVRADPDHAGAWHAWCDVRDDLFARHPQSPLDPLQRARFSGLAYFDYDPSAAPHGRRHTVTTILPRAWPSPRYRNASAVSLSS